MSQLSVNGYLGAVNHDSNIAQQYLTSDNSLIVAELLRFPVVSAEKFDNSLTPEEQRKLSVSEVKKGLVTGSQDSDEAICFCDGEIGYILWLDNNPLCIISYDQIGSAVLIKQIQSITIEGKYRGDRIMKCNFDLQKFDWTKVLVDLTERISKIHGKLVICILPSLAHPAYQKERSDQLGKIYDGTATCLGYSQFESGNDDYVGVYYKSIKNGENLDDIPYEWRSFMRKDILESIIYNR